MKTRRKDYLTERTINVAGNMLMADVEAPPEHGTTTPDESDAAVDMQQWLACQVGQERYLIAVTMIKEIIRLPDCTMVPRSPQWLRGVCSLRGVVIAIIDVGTRLGLAPCRMTAKIDTTPTLLAAPHREFIRGLVHHDDAVYVLLDLQRLLTFSEHVAETSC